MWGPLGYYYLQCLVMAQDTKSTKNDGKNEMGRNKPTNELSIEVLYTESRFLVSDDQVLETSNAV